MKSQKQRVLDIPSSITCRIYGAEKYENRETYGFLKLKIKIVTPIKDAQGKLISLTEENEFNAEPFFSCVVTLNQSYGNSMEESIDKIFMKLSAIAECTQIDETPVIRELKDLAKEQNYKDALKLIADKIEERLENGNHMYLCATGTTTLSVMDFSKVGGMRWSPCWFNARYFDCEGTNYLYHVINQSGMSINDEHVKTKLKEINETPF